MLINVLLIFLAGFLSALSFKSAGIKDLQEGNKKLKKQIKDLNKIKNKISFYYDIVNEVGDETVEKIDIQVNWDKETILKIYAADYIEILDKIFVRKESNPLNFITNNNQIFREETGENKCKN